MSTEEYRGHLVEAFEKEHFDGKDGFIFSKSAMEHGLNEIEWQTIDMETTVEETTMPNLTKKQLRHGLRQSQAVVDILKRCLDGVIFKMVSKTGV